MPIQAGRILGWLLPGVAERDEKLRQELLKASHLGLRLIGAVAVGVPLLLLLARVSLVPGPTTPAGRLPPALAIILTGVAAIVVAQTRWSRPRGRSLAAISIWVIAAMLIGFSLFMAAPSAEYRLSGYITLLMLIAVAAIPLRPPEALALGLAIEASYLACCLAAHRWDLLEHLFVVALALVSSALAGVIYAQRLTNYRQRQQALRANEYLCMAQTRVLLSENAASLGRLAATLVHELNSPLGALSSAVDTLIMVSARQVTATPEQQPRLLTLQADLRRSIQSSLERLQSIIGRLRRLSGLHEAEFQSVNLNELLRDVAGLVQTQTQDQITLDFDLHPLPALICQPQQLSAVFTNLLTNASNAMNGSGRIRISTEQKDGQVEIRIQDFGCGISDDDLAEIFEPGFKISGQRMSTGNWSLFSCRQIIHGHGGEIYLTSAEGKGSTAVITLPL